LQDVKGTKGFRRGGLVHWSAKVEASSEKDAR